MLHSPVGRAAHRDSPERAPNPLRRPGRGTLARWAVDGAECVCLTLTNHARIVLWNAPIRMVPMVDAMPKIALVTEPLASRTLPEIMDWVMADVPEIVGLEIGTGAYAPTSHCDMPRLL